MITLLNCLSKNVGWPIMTTAAGSATSTTGIRTRTSATGGAGCTSAGRSAHRRSGRSTKRHASSTRRGPIRSGGRSCGSRSSPAPAEANSARFAGSTSICQRARSPCSAASASAAPRRAPPASGRALRGDWHADARRRVVFSLPPDLRRSCCRTRVSERYRDLADRLGIATSPHTLRHYSAVDGASLAGSGT
jgi:hypothetical protein